MSFVSGAEGSTQTKKEIQLGTQTNLEQNMRVCYQVAHRTVSGAPGLHASKHATLRNSLGTLRYNSLDCLMSQRSNGQYASTVNCKSEQWWTVRGRSQSIEVRGHQTCPVWHRTIRCNGSNGQVAPNPNERADVACTGQWTVSVRCATGLSDVPIASKNSQRLGSGWRL
jgi:hypothetical protein